ncbi:9,11-endoperoxide prostaglandin H2 reductase-like [Oppia nitens]|uniref:9,11-endoperoxide prostaglandin H2 reductase-like n=1 Tax=Oppia nitens TaxID=1686743 RepID=UPI0023DC103F|nr:9,11-endoperoxide prostaglandin H2 reductase-like [Oppia nitens]
MNSFSNIILFVVICLVNSENVSRTLRLSSGYNCPLVGIGCGGYRTGGPPQGKVVIQMINDAVDVGYKHIDTASSYLNEAAIGQAINDLLDRNVIQRHELFVTTKITYSSSNTSAEALHGVRVALQKLNLTYLDLMLLHSPASDEINRQVWSGLEEAVQQKLVRSIGVSNFNIKQLETLLKTSPRIVPAINQVESHPQLNQQPLIDYCTKQGIHLTAYSPLGAGTLIKDPTITAIGKRYNKTAAQVLIRYEVQRGIIAIPKSLKKNYIKENIDVFDFELTTDDMKTLNDMK